MTWDKQHIKDLTAGRTYVLRNLRVPVCALHGDYRHGDDGLSAVDIEVRDGKIATVSPAAATGLGGQMAWPATIDAHTHIDKGQVWPRSPNPDGSFACALVAAAADKIRVPALNDLRKRAEFSLRSAYAYGTIAMRSHVDAGEDFDRRFAVLKDLAIEWRGRIELSLAPFTGVEEPPERVKAIAAAARDKTAGTLSVFLYSCKGLPGFLDLACGLAEQHGLALDFHADETLDPNSHCTRAVAEAVIRNRFQGPVLVGHCCALSQQDPETLSKSLDLIATAGLDIVSLPQCNTYLMDRGSTTPRLRGLAPVHELRARGIRLAIASDNTRDPFHAYGDLDVPELFRDAMRLMHLDHPVGNWPATVLSDAADVIGKPDLGRITVGSPADLILFSARNWSEFGARPARDRLVIRRGRLIDAAPPDFDELDELEGFQP